MSLGWGREFIDLTQHGFIHSSGSMRNRSTLTTKVEDVRDGGQDNIPWDRETNQSMNWQIMFPKHSIEEGNIECGFEILTYFSNLRINAVIQ